MACPLLLRGCMHTSIFLGPLLRRAVATSTLISLSCFAITRARAETPTATVDVRSADDVSVGEVVGDDRRQLCHTPCRITASAQLHHFYFEANGAPGVDLHLDVGRDARLEVAAGSRGWRVVGLALTALGMVAGAAGVFTLATRNGPVGDRNAPKWALPAAVGGIAVAGIGLGIFISSATTVEVDGRPVTTSSIQVTGAF